MERMEFLNQPMANLFNSAFTKALIDALVASAAFILAHVLRFEGWPPETRAVRMWLLLPYIALGRVIMHYIFGIYKRVWRYASISDATLLAAATSLFSLLLLIPRILIPKTYPVLLVPFGIILIDALLAIFFFIGIRFSTRIFNEMSRDFVANVFSPKLSHRRVLLVGAGDAGIMTLREIKSRPQLQLTVCGFVDDDAKKQNLIIQGVKVLGRTEDLRTLAKSHEIHEIIITMASASRKTVQRILDNCRNVSLPVRIIPGLYEILGNRVTVSRLRPVEIEDLLGRDTIDFTDWYESTKEHYHQKTVLVTGGAGSIGRELSRQLTLLQPSHLILLDKDEHSIYEAEKELLTLAAENKVQLTPAICNLLVPSRVQQVFRSYRPDIVIHAAAHKHVPLMERNPFEAILNNIVGTITLLKAAEQYLSTNCVMVSTDKAVNPTSIMGATKRISELLFQAQALRLNGRSRFSCVRFGNVLGSRGSVIPLFREQIRQGGPITITHKDMMRFFMTIPEASQLILQAGAMGHKGEIYVLDMGDPVPLVDLARDMIQLSGLILGEDIEIKYIGVRPGEKMKEELKFDSEGLTRTSSKKILIANPVNYDYLGLDRFLSELIGAAESGNQEEIYSILHQMNIGFFREPNLRAMV
jgi:FlaA1/EpsC-like NDP-sugar epimerase